MKPNKKPRRKKFAAKKKASRSPSLFADLDELPPRAAFRSFKLEDEWHGRRRMRGIGKCTDSSKLAPNSFPEIDTLYMEALGKDCIKWELCHNRAGKRVYQGKHVQASAEDAAKDLLSVAKNATIFLSLLLEREPELCRRIAATKSEWPVLADMTEKDWRSPIAEAISKLELGNEIKGYLVAARTADQNVVRCWATAIYETLYQTRFDFKRSLEKPDRHTTTEGCPDWARKTLDLPKFSKVNARRWAKLGEEMLLEQVPNFLDSPDLVAKKRSWTHRANKDARLGKASLRAIHREAFEDFAKELKNLAPEKEIWRGKW